MKPGDEQYKKALRRWTVLRKLDNPTPRQAQERDALNAELERAERAASIERVVSDYDEAMKNANSLGTVEL